MIRRCVICWLSAISTLGSECHKQPRDTKRIRSAGLPPIQDEDRESFDRERATSLEREKELYEAVEMSITPET